MGLVNPNTANPNTFDGPSHYPNQAHPALIPHYNPACLFELLNSSSTECISHVPPLQRTPEMTAKVVAALSEYGSDEEAQHRTTPIPLPTSPHTLHHTPKKGCFRVPREHLVVEYFVVAGGMAGLLSYYGHHVQG